MKVRNYNELKQKKLSLLGVRVPLVFACYIVASVVLSVLMAIFAAGKSSELIIIEKAIALAERENKDMTYLLVKETSLSYINEKVETLALEPPDEVIYLNNLRPSFAKLP